MNPCWTIFLFVFLLASPTNAGLFKRPLDPDPLANELTKKVDPSDEKKVPEPSPMMAPKPHQPTLASETTMEPTKAQMVVDTLDVQRTTNQVRVTLTNVDDLSILSPAETMFFEDCFIAAFVQSQNDGTDTDVNVRSMIVLIDESLRKTNRLRGSDRSLWSTPGQYFDISALLEWSCHLCSGSSPSRTGSSGSIATTTTYADDDHRDDDFYYNGPRRPPPPPPKSRPTPPPKSRPTPPPKTRPTTSKRSMVDDDFVHADDDSMNVHNHNDMESRDEDYSDADPHVFADATTNPTNDSNQKGDTVDDDVFSVFFGKRVLQESDERRFEELLCNKLRAGPFQAFRRVHECFVLFLT